MLLAVILFVFLVLPTSIAVVAGVREYRRGASLREAFAMTVLFTGLAVFVPVLGYTVIYFTLFDKNEQKYAILWSDS